MVGSLVLLASLFVVAIVKPAFTQTIQDERLATILERISKTTPEGMLVLDRIQNMKPELIERPSAKTLIEIVQDHAFNKGAYNLTIIGWEATQKRLIPGETSVRWKIVLYYRDWKMEYQAAEWEYSQDKNKIYAFEKDNAPGFWSDEGRVSKRRIRQ
jgi:hypothetical protein